MNTFEMYIYAQLNEHNICIGISQLSGKVNADNLIVIDQVDSDYLWRKYENGQWSEEKFLPDYGSIQLDRMETVEQAIAELSILIAGGGE